MGTIQIDEGPVGVNTDGARHPGDEEHLVGSGAEGTGEPAPQPVPRTWAWAAGARTGTERPERETFGNPQRLLLDSVEVAAMLGLSRTRVFQMMARAELPVIRIGRLVRVPRSGLEEWIGGATETPGRLSGGRGQSRRVGWGVGGP